MPAAVADVERGAADGVAVEAAIRHLAQAPPGADVASALDLSERTIHRCVVVHATIFARVLFAQRVVVARRMLDASNLRSLTVGEICRRAGFTDPSHFGRVMTRPLGCTPGRYRRRRVTASLDARQPGCEGPPAMQASATAAIDA